jgi:hypothetical protein
MMRVPLGDRVKPKSLAPGTAQIGLRSSGVSFESGKSFVPSIARRLLARF